MNYFYILVKEENKHLMEKVEKLEGEYGKVRKALEFIMSVVECRDTEDLKRKVFEKRKMELMAPRELSTK